jgi:hypothetical protein
MAEEITPLGIPTNNIEKQLITTPASERSTVADLIEPSLIDKLLGDGKGKKAINNPIVQSILGGMLQKRTTQKGLEAGQDILQEEGRLQSEEGKKLYEAMLDKLRREDPVAQAQRDLAADTKVAAEEFIDATRRRGDEQSAASIDALVQDPRMAALLPKQAQQIEQNLQQAELLGLDRKVAADSAVAGLEQAGKDFKRGLDVGEMQRGGAGAEAGRQMELNAMLQELQAPYTGTQQGIQTGSALLAALKDYDELANKNPADDNVAKDGMKTNGEFDHDTNPKAIVDEDTGVKEGEVTGGELIFNPKQSNTMEDFVKEGNAEGLLEYMKDLLSKPQFQ